MRRGSGAGDLVWEGTLTKGGESQRFTGKKLWIAVAKPANLSLTLNGSRLPKLEPTATVLTVTAEGVRVASRSE